MLVDDCCLLFGVQCLSCVGVVCGWLFLGCVFLLVGWNWCLMFDVCCCLLIGVCCLLFVVWCFVMC